MRAVAPFAATFLFTACQTTTAPRPAAPIQPAAATPAAPAPVPAEARSNDEESLPGERLELARIFADPPLAGRPPSQLAFSPDGRRVTFLRASEEDSDVLDLWAMELPDGAPRPLVRSVDVVDKAAMRVSEEERMALERKRIHQQGITSYRFCGESGRALLFPLSGDLYHVKLHDEGEGKPVVKRLTRDGEAKLDPKCSPKGRYVSFTKERDLYLIEVSTRKTRRITKSRSPTRSYGVAEFIAQEEMGRYEGTFFSPDERYLAYTDVDERSVSVKLRPFIYSDRTEMFAQRYPAAGEKNAKVRVIVLDLKTKKRVALKLPKEDGYVARVGFATAGTVYVVWQSRDQRRVVLFGGSAPDFWLMPLLEEIEEAWVELHDDLHFLGDGTRFVWSSEREGAKRLYLAEVGKKDLTPLTPGEDPVVELVGVDEKEGRVYYTRATDRSLERHLFSCTLRGDDERRLTHDPGVHDVTFGAGGYLVDRASSFGVPPRIRLLSQAGEVVRAIDDEAAAELSRYAQPEAAFLTVPAEDGTEMNALLLPPIVRHEGRGYPVIVYVYGGPTAQLVSKSWMRLYPFFVHLTQNGYGVFIVDNRGTSHRDRAFTRALKGRVGDLEVRDQQHAARELLAKTDWVDRERIGVFGWSYGGYVSALSVLDENTPFRAAVAVAPVTDWSLYDTHYTERYLGSPAANAEAYARASVLPKAKNLASGKRALFLLHGMADDNVLFQHSLQLVSALQRESVPFDLMVYPGRAHGLSGKDTQLHVFRSIVSFFDRELKDDR